VVSISLPPAVERALLGLCVVVGVVWRGARHLGLDPAPLEPPLFKTPYLRPPLLDLLTVPLPDRQWTVLLLAAGTILITGAIARRALGSSGGVAAAALAAVCPALLHAGSVWIPQSLIVLSVPALALAILAALDAERPSALPVAALGVLALASDWSAWPPVLAWLGWTTVLRPEWMDRDQARPVARGLGLAVGVSAPAYVLLSAAHPNLHDGLGVSTLPLGADAVSALLDTLGAPWLGVGRDLPALVRVGSAAAVVAAMVLGPRRANATGQHVWAGVLLVGSAGALVPALAAHPWLALAAAKHVWYMSPFVLCLALAAVWPVRVAPVLALLAVALPGCVDVDGDGWFASDDCDDEDASVHPGAWELWDGRDNDCDGAIDVSPDYLFADEQEPNDTTLGSCFAPGGQDLGPLPRAGLLTRIDGRVDQVVDGSYEDGDLDCFAFRMGPDSKAARLQITLSWPDPATDLDMALWGLFEGEQAGFIQATTPGPGPEVHVSSGAFEAGEPLWLWIAAYDGPPTDYSVEILAR
jgi:hypothetical protein